MVQDDEYVSISSANLNQRSLDGTRDTELGMGAWQPAYTLATARHGQQGGGVHSNPGESDSVNAGPAEGYMDERGGNYADVDDESRDEQGGGQAYSLDGRQNVSSSGKSGSGGHQGWQDSTGVNPGNVAGASRAGAVQQSDSEPSTRAPSMTSQPNLNSHHTPHHAEVGEVSQHAGTVPVGVLMPQPPSATWGQASDLDPIEPDFAAQEQPVTGSTHQGSSMTAASTGNPAAQEQTPAVTSKHTVQAGESKQQQQQPHQQQTQHGQQSSNQIEEGSHKGSALQQDGPARGGVKPGQKAAYPKGEVYGYRMALWLEHLGGKYDPLYDQPHSLECIKRVNDLAEQNWMQFSGEEDVDMTGHLITFPIIVDRNGDVKPRTDGGQFDDIKNSVLGKSRPIPAMFLN